MPITPSRRMALFYHIDLYLSSRFFVSLEPISTTSSFPAFVDLYGDSSNSSHLLIQFLFQYADKLILETILQDKFFYVKAEEGGVTVATATDDNAEIRNLGARLFEKSTCRYTRVCLKNASSYFNLT